MSANGSMMESNPNCDNCDKSFSSKKTLWRHKRYVCKPESTPPLSQIGEGTPSALDSSPKPNIMSSATARSSTQTPSGSVKHPASPAVSVAKKIVAYECEQCNKLFRTKERLILHRQEHVKSEDEGKKGVNFPNQLKQEGQSDKTDEHIKKEKDSQDKLSKSVMLPKLENVEHVKSEDEGKKGVNFPNKLKQVVHSETEHIKNDMNEKDSQDKLSKSVKLPKLEYQTMLDKMSQIEEVRRKEMVLSKKFDFVKSVISKREASTVSIPKSELLFLQEKSSALPTFNQKLECLSLKLIKVKQLISTKEAASRNQEESKPDLLNISNKPETFKVFQKPQKEPKSSLRNRVKLPLTVVANEVKKEKIPLDQYQEMLMKSKNLETIDQRHQCLIERLSSIKKIVLSKSKLFINSPREENTTSLNHEENEKVLELHEMLEPKIILKEEEFEFVTTNEPMNTETIEAKTPDKFLKLKSKLQDTLSKRAKLNSKIEAIMQKKFSNNSEEMVEQRMKARLEREATVREVQRRMDEKKEAEKEKELSLKEKTIRQTLEALRNDVRDASEDAYPQEGNAKKKSRREMRRHLQEKVEPKPELAMSRESRMENIREMEEEIAVLQRRMAQFRSGAEAEQSSEERKNEENHQTEECSIETQDTQAKADTEKDEPRTRKEEIEDEDNRYAGSLDESLNKMTVTDLYERKEEKLEVNNENDCNSSLLEHFGNYDDEAGKTHVDSDMEVEVAVLNSSDSFNDAEEIVDDDREELLFDEYPVFEEQGIEEFIEVPVEFELSPENEMEDILESIIKIIINRDINSDQDIRVSEVISEAIIEDLVSFVIDISDLEQHSAENMVFTSDEFYESETETDDDFDKDMSKVFTLSENCVSSLISDDDTDTVAEGENCTAAAMWDILDERWSQTETFKEVFNHDESSREILAIFEAGSLTRQFLLESLCHLGWVTSESADFLPQGWFMKMNMDTFSRKGRVSFIFLDENLVFCLNPFEASIHMKHKLYEGNVIETFVDNFKDDTLSSESSCDDSDISFERSLPYHQF